MAPEVLQPMNKERLSKFIPPTLFSGSFHLFTRKPRFLAIHPFKNLFYRLLINFLHHFRLIVSKYLLPEFLMQ